ncbi:ATP-binding protein [Sporomusa termitida]|nr:ATP-binding protein [Sporomusa termitida]
MYRERHIGLWALAWFLLLMRNIFFDSGIFDWKQSILFFLIYQLLFIGCSLTFVWGTYRFIDRPFNRFWLYGAISASLLSMVCFLLSAPITYTLILPTWFAGIVLAWIAAVFLRQVEVTGMGRIITGVAFTLWSILTIAMPFYIQAFPLVITIISGILRLIIAISTVIVFLEKSRLDLINKETQYRLLAENAADTIYFYQIYPTAQLQYVNPAVHLLTGYTPEEFYKNNRLVFALIHADDRRLLENFIRDFPKSIETTVTLRLVRKNKISLWIEQKCTAIYTSHGKIAALQGIIRDITSRKDLALDRMTMVGNMAATVAHEIRNPMTTVRGYLQLMGGKETYQTDKKKFELMLEEIDQANSIINEYLSLSRSKFSNFELCSLNAIIEALLPQIQADATSAAVSVALDLNIIPELLLDENEIHQLLLNLVRNSIEAMPAGGSLVIKTTHATGQVILSVCDQGLGIPAYILDKLGTPFITSKNTGAGLGIPICYQIAHRHNALIKINTSAEGTIFLVYFNTTSA